MASFHLFIHEITTYYACYTITTFVALITAFCRGYYERVRLACKSWSIGDTMETGRSERNIHDPWCNHGS